MSIDLNKVFDLNRNVFIEACAGAGKTWLLSKRYAAIMDDFARQHAENPQSLNDASNILVITFTRKAADEMSGRIYSDLNQLLNDESLDHAPDNFGSHLRHASNHYKMHLRSTYSRNAISTIDSFCTQILRDQAENIGLDPEFRIQDEADTQRMELETWEKFLRERSRNQDEDLKLLLDNLSVYHLSEAIKKLQNHSQLMSEWLEHQSSHTPDQLQDEFRAAHPLPTSLKQIEQSLIALIEGLPSETEMLNPSHQHYRNFTDLLTFLSAPIEDDYRYGLELMEFVRRFSLTSTRDKYLSRVSIPTKVWTPEWTGEIRERLKTFIANISDLLPIDIIMNDIPNKWDLQACVVQHHLAKFFLNYLKALNLRLKREGVLSFNEVIVQTRQLLQNPKTAAHYGQRFKHILFDEFQDTNDLRWDIVRLIAEGGQSKLRDRGLFIVGDTKQSIYRFNQADVQVMNRVQQIIGEDRGLILTADETYRSSKKFVETVINPIMSVAFPGDDEKVDMKLYETPFRPTTAAEHSPLSDEQHQLSRCVLSAVLEDEESRGTAADVLHVADLSRDWLNWVDQHPIPQGDGPVIGILLRSFTHILDYIRVFTARGLQFEVLSSKGLYAQQESFDIYHLLSVLVNPLDDLALIGLLRSPFFIMTDAEIQALREHTDGKNYSGWAWNSLMQVQPETADIIKLWQRRMAREPVDRMIQGILAEGERSLGWISETGGVLRLANMDRMILTIHQLALDGLGLREILEYFKFQIQHGDASQAELPGKAQIQILTIHKSKGLEFPVVILPSLQSPAVAEKSGLYLGREAEQWQAGITLDSLTASHKTWMFERIKSQTKAEEEAEDKRLFYVALTRARYGVSFVAKINPSRQPSSNTRWKRYLAPVFDVDLDKDMALNDPRSLQFEWKSRSTPGLVYDLVLGSDLLKQEISHQSSIDDQHIPLPETGSRLVYEEISPHTIMSWFDHSSSVGADERKRGDDLGLETSPLKFGRLLHRAMEMEWFDIDKFEEPIRLFLEDEGIGDKSDQQPFMDDLQQCLSIYSSSHLAKKLATLSHNDKLPELPLFGYLQSDTRVFKVSGIIDLLYQDGDDWVILDYKTDKELPVQPEQFEYAYWYQIQSYQWMLKLLYGIEARGEIYFNRFDQIINIEYNEQLYFSRLAKLEQGLGLEAILPGGKNLSPELNKILTRLQPSDQTIIIEPTQNSGEQLAQSLNLSGVCNPRLQLMTTNEFRKLTELGGRRLTPYLTRLGIARLLGKQSPWGVVNRLAIAFYKATQGEQISPGKAKLYADFLTWCDTQNIRLPGQDWNAELLPSQLKIIVNSFHSTTPSDYEFLTELSEKRDLVFLDPLQEGKAVSGFAMSRADWMNQTEMPRNDAQHNYTPCFSIHEEVVLTASKILELLQTGVAPAHILIAVSSMERYVPTIKQVFEQVGISVRLSKREPVMERPVTHLAFALIQGRLAHHLSWDMAMSVWLNPLVLPSGALGSSRQKLDIEARKLGITILDDSLPERFTNSALIQASKDLLKFVNQQWHKGRNNGLVQEAVWLQDTFKRFKLTQRLEPGSVASKAYTSLKNAIVGTSNDWARYLSRKGTLGDLNREIKERLKGVEVSSTQQGFGVDVISLLDSLNMKSDHLFVMGMTEGQFPLAPDSNPYLTQSTLNPWFLNLYLFKRWLSRPSGGLHITAPMRNSDGASLQESTFCQYLKKRDYPKLPLISRSQQLPGMTGKLFTTPKSKYQIRHNELSQNPGRGDWYGQLTPHDLRAFEKLSASAFDELIKCPQRYWYSRKLRLEPAETDIAERHEIEVGNLVHKVLEVFGKQGGFLLAATNLPAAIDQLEACALTWLDEQKIDPEATLLDGKWSELYFQNFQDPKRNLLTSMLEIEAPVLTEYATEGLHEQAFGFPDDKHSWPACEIENDSLKLTLRGKIDRVMVKGDQVWATDYKTGRVDIKDSREFWTSQMLFYYLVLKSRFPEKNVILTYEQVKAFRENAFGFKGYVGDLSDDDPVMATKPSRAKPFVSIGENEDWSVESITEKTMEYAQFLADNSFPLTIRDESRACAYCPFDRICRKTALPR